MPTYEYHCSKCKASYELRQGFDAETSHACEECGKGVAKRVLHAPRVVFKGSGWYVTDSRKATSAISDNGSSAPASPAESTSTESPAKKDSGSSPEAAAAS
ncbi:MAG TPA: FmdB family zinc ribbon protein [Tepidiformaceae bacterium]|nr:FmdB family zinc ribbon protein [Tepidiformaceae bacterium]